MNEFRDIIVRAGSESYPVILNRHRRKLFDVPGGSNTIVVISNPTIYALHGKALVNRHLPKDRTVIPLMMGDGERFKTLRTVNALYDHFFDIGLERTDTVVAFGGGVVGDTCGYAAATFKRGIRLIHVPTTLLAMVDASIGSKVGVNHRLGKNQIGAFYPPQAVIIDPAWLVTLGSRETAGGAAEIIKAGMLSSERLLGAAMELSYEYIAAEREKWLAIIREAIRFKAKIVSRDVFDTGIRMILNFGHTFGHAIETAEKYRRYRHGEAVLAGMAGALYLSRMVGLLSDKRLDRYLDYLRPWARRLPPLRRDIDGYLAPMSVDKKNKDAKRVFVLLERIGRPKIQAVDSRSQVAEAIAAMKEFVNSGGRR